MRNRLLTRCLLALLLALPFVTPAHADEARPDDSISFELSAEDWVTTKTARVSLNVEAAVNAANAGSMRADMTKAVDDAAKADWRLTGFNRTQDQTGMERWSVSFEARLPENALNGLADSVKKASKPGMQITVGDIDFSPTLEETEALRASLRAHIIKEAADQLATLNGALPGRQYRISQITFEQVNMPLLRRPHLMMAMSASPAANNGNDNDSSQEHSQKMTLNAHIVYAALPPAPAH